MNNQKQFFSVSLACDLLGKSPNQVLEQSTAFDPQLVDANSLSADESFSDTFDTHVFFLCHFELQDYQAFSSVCINFVSSTAVECIISLGKPANPERYGSEFEVAKAFLVSLEESYLNGRIQEESEPGTRVYTWKKDNKTVISFVSRPTSGSPNDTGALLSIQIRDTQLHPQGAYCELLYNQAKKTVQGLGHVTLHRKDEPLEKVYERRSARYHLTSFLMWTAIVLGIVGIISLVSKNFAAGTILIILAALCAFLMGKLDYEARRDYRQKRTMLQYSTRRNEKLGDESNSSTLKVDSTSVEALDISPQLESFCSDYVTALAEALDTAIRVGHEEYEAGFNLAMDLLCGGGAVIQGRNSFQFGVSKKDRPQVLAEVKRYAAESATGIPYNRASPLNQFFVTIPPYIFYCLEKYLPHDPGLREEARRLMNTRGFPRYLQEDLGYPISQKIKGAFWVFSG
jgi:hypothetical protein